MSFLYLTLFLFGKFMKNFAQIFSDAAKHDFAPIFWDPHYVVLAIPTAVT
jgi:hypothetical protein